MKTTKSVAYALACIHELAKKMGELVQVSEIAYHQNIPAAYCQKILFALSKVGIVMSVKGQGFCLVLSPDMISTLRVMQALSEGPAFDVDQDGTLKAISESLSAKVNAALAKLTVADLMVTAR